MIKMQQIDSVRLLTDSELDFVIGGASLGGSTVGMSVNNAQRVATAQQLEMAYAHSHPFDYYGYFG
jgi:hypothetical protein